MRSTRSNLAAGCAAAITFAFTASSLHAQCATTWQGGLGIPGTNGTIHASTTWDRDGAGPQPPLVVLGGQFTSAGTTITNNIVAYDPASGQWSQFGSGATNPVAQPLASAVTALIALPNGDLVAAGTFTDAGGIAVNNIARWNGSSWSPLGSGILPNLGVGVVLTLTVLANGDLVAGGFFTTAGGIPAPSLARWNGSTWSAMCSSMTPAHSYSYAFVRDVVQLPNGELIVAGDFGSIDGVTTNCIARWNGSAWSPLGLGTDGAISDVEVLSNGDLVVGGYFYQAGTAGASRIARWDGSSWSAVGGASNFVLTLELAPNGDLFAGGGFSTIGNAVVMHFGRWNGTAWSAPAIGQGGLGGADDRVTAGTVLPNGDLVVGGLFRTIGGVGANRVARWNGAAWSALGNGIGDSLGIGVMAITNLPNGDVVIGGTFTSANGSPADYVARWNGTYWSSVGNGPGGPVYGLAVLPNGNIVAAGSGFAGPGFSDNFVVRWDGIIWHPMAAEHFGVANSLAVEANGNLLVGGSFHSLNGSPIRGIARWNGATWSPLGNPTNGMGAIEVLANGDVVAASGLGSIGSIERWNGAAWSTLGTLNGQARRVRALPDGDLLVGGDFISVNGTTTLRLARLTGATWTTQGSGFSDSIDDLLSLPNGDIVAMGSFDAAGGVASAKVARLASNCRATATSQGIGCVGSAGQNVLLARSLPWTGSTLRASVSGIPQNALVLAVYGFTPISLPMATVLPQGLPGCEVRMLPDYTELLLPANGIAQTALAIPDVPALAGLVLHHYVVPFEVDAALNILAVTSSNSLLLTVGTF